MELEHTNLERDQAYIAGWKAQKIDANPYKPETDLARWFVDGWVAKVIAARCGLINV